MDKHDLLPFKVGQLAESRSFLAGFRGAWFRCKIKEIGQRKGQIVHALEFFDFPDEKINWTQLYQKPPIHRSKLNDVERQLMVRPRFPPIYHESQMPDVNTISEVMVIVDGVWNVGDLVDWWTDGCYWSGRVTLILGDDKLQIELPQPPVGEGASYEVFCKDLRPSLDWSPEYGWTVPITTASGNFHCCARLIQPINRVAGSLLGFHISVSSLPSPDRSKCSPAKEIPKQPLSINVSKEGRHRPESDADEGGLPKAVHAVDEGETDVQATVGSLLEFNASFSSHISASSLPPPDRSKFSLGREISKQPLSITVSKEETHTPETHVDLDMEDSGIAKASCSDSVSSSHVRDASAKIAGNTAGKDRYCNSGSSKKMRTGGSIPLNSICSDTLEAAVLDLEELANRIKWLKGILEFGIPLPDAMRPSWKFLEHRASSTPK